MLFSQFAMISTDSIKATSMIIIGIIMIIKDSGNRKKLAQIRVSQLSSFLEGRK